MSRSWGKEKIVQAFEDWFREHGQEPTAADWKKAEDTHPSYQTVWVEFGSWNNALEQWRKVRKRRRPWSREEIIEAFQKWDNEHGRPPVSQDAQGTPDLPSPSSVRREFGSWNAAISESGFIPVPRGLPRKFVERYLPLPRNR